jgi:hypothetical protein
VSWRKVKKLVPGFLCGVLSATMGLPLWQLALLLVPVGLAQSFGRDEGWDLKTDQVAKAVDEMEARMRRRGLL